MANVFLPIVVPATTGSGAALNVSSLGYNKLFSLVGSFGSVLSLGATINIEASNDGVAWVPVATLTAANDVRRSFAAVFVRATVIGDATGATLSVGSDDPGTDMIAIPTPVANGTGAPVNISTFGMEKTFIYNGAMEACITVEISQDGVTYTEAISFVGKMKAHYNLTASIEFVRVRVSGYDGSGGTPTVSVCAVKALTSASASLSPGTATRFKLYVRPTGNNTTGDGTLASPYLTIPRALEDVPNIIRGGDRYVVEVSDYGVYDLSAGVLVIPEENYSLDPYVSIAGVDYTPFVTEAPITIQAVPTVVQVILASDVTSVTSLDGLATKRMVTTLALAPGALAGTFLVTGGAITGVIYDNDATDIFFVGSPGIGDYDVVLPSTALINGSILMSNVRCEVQFNGLGLGISGVIEKSVAPGFLMSSHDGGAWYFEDNDGQLRWEQVYLGTGGTFTHKGHTRALYYYAATSLVGTVSITANAGSYGEIADSRRHPVGVHGGTEAHRPRGVVVPRLADVGLRSGRRWAMAAWRGQRHRGHVLPRRSGERDACHSAHRRSHRDRQRQGLGSAHRQLHRSLRHPGSPVGRRR